MYNKVQFKALFVQYVHNDKNTWCWKDVLQIKIVLEKEANKLMHWFAKNSLAANPTEFQTMLLCGNNKRKMKDLNLIVENTKLESTSIV